MGDTDKCVRCSHERRFFYHEPRADNEARCWYEDEDGFCGCKCEYAANAAAATPSLVSKDQTVARDEMDRK